ncbi:MAG: amidohydrolase family protein [Chloroflexota bacterium]|nr:amidohydrolase family protein [Chloroflexota bacterium]
MPAVPAALAEPIDRLPLLDHHCHGVRTNDPPSAEAFEGWIAETTYPAAPGTSRWDTPVGLAIRRWCAPLLDLPPFPSPEAYLARRLELGAAAVNRRLLRATGAATLLLDSGLRAGDIADSAAMANLSGATTREIVRLEAVAEEVARGGVTAEAYPSAYAELLRARSAEAVGLKTIVAYRHGFAFDPAPPSRDEVVAGVGRWLRAVDASIRPGPAATEGLAGVTRAARGGEAPSPPRLAEPAVLRHAIWTGAELARERGLPLQVHVGYGDPDLTLHLTNPSLLTDLLRRFEDLGVTVTLLHCYPYHREAAYLADMFPRVYLDLGLALTFAGASAGRLLAEALEGAPFTKLLYSSDGYGAAELHFLGAVHFRRALARALAAWLADDACTVAEAERIARLACSGNARRIYPLG